MLIFASLFRASRLAEELMPFLDHGVLDPAASRLAAASKRTRPSFAQGSSRTSEEEPSPAGTAAPASEPSAPAARPPPEVDVAAVQAASLARLPPEETGPLSCRVAVRCPDGSRLQRRFPRDARLAALRDLCVGSCEEAARGRAFELLPSLPGRPALVLEEGGQTLGDAGVADALLTMRWVDA